jgi:dihydrodipicolinate synthase/N-acetylneuraminate lyase
MPALITPFSDGGDIDADAHASNVALLSSRDVEGFLIAGSTGEGPYLEPGERRTLVALAREAATGAYLMCGLSAESLRAAIAQIHEAAEGGADAVLVPTPTTLIRGRDNLVAGFYRDVAVASPLPVFLYSVPKVTGYEMPVSVAVDLRDHASVCGMKDSGGQPVRVPELLANAPEGFSLYSGSTPALGLSVTAGARGGITASSNYASAMATAVVRMAASSPSVFGDAQAALTRTATAVEQHGIPGVKAAAALTGLDVGALRRPLVPVSPETEASIAASLEAASII